MKHIILCVLLGAPSAAFAADAWSILGTDRHNKIVLVETAKGTDGNVYRAAGPKVCPGSAKCTAWFWIDKAKVPTGIYGMSESSRYAVTAKYSTDPNGPVLVFDCKVVKAEGKCFPGTQQRR